VQKKPLNVSKNLTLQLLTQLLGFERVCAQKMLKIREFCEAVSFCGAKTPIDSVGVTRA
jgi:hypothetical protein